MAEDTKKVKTGCSVIACGCESAFQDRVYGKGRRLHNNGGKTKCTICGNVKN